MKYTKEMTDDLVEMYNKEVPLDKIAKELKAKYSLVDDLPERSLIAKLASIGAYKRKEYVNKRGERPVKKEEYVERIAKLLDVNIELLESLEKVNKNVLRMIETGLQIAKDDK